MSHRQPQRCQDPCARERNRTVKLVPYPSWRAAIPALALVAVNGTAMLGPAVQLAAGMFVLMLAFKDLQVDLRNSWLLLAYVAIMLGIGVLAFGPHQAVVKAGKIAFFCLASVLSVRGASSDNRFPALLALRAFLALCVANFLLAAVIGGGVFRASHLIEFSIYSSYTIAFLIYMARPHLTVADRGVAWACSLMCGSTMGIMLLILAEIVGRRIRLRTAFAALVAAPFGLVALNFLMTVRGKELSWAYLASSDRAKILTTFFDTIVPTFSASNWLFGIGVGAPLHRFVSTDSVFDNYLKRVGEGEIYSFCLHNEPLRILCDFGLVGLLLIVLRLCANCSIPVLILLGISMMTNSYLYSFSGALIASSLFNAKVKVAHESTAKAQLYPAHA